MSKGRKTQAELRLPNEPIRSPEQEYQDRKLLAEYFSSDRNEPTQEEIAAYCRELRNDPEWINNYHHNLEWKGMNHVNHTYEPKRHKLRHRND